MEGDLGQQELGVNAHQLPVPVVQVPLRREGPGSGSLPGSVPRTPQDPACCSAGQEAELTSRVSSPHPPTQALFPQQAPLRPPEG